MSTPQTPRAISPPTAKTAESVVSVPVPSAATNKAPVAIGTPTAITNEAVGTISTPTAKTSQAVASIATPTAITSEVVGSITTPTAKTSQAVGTISTPTASTAQTVGTISTPTAATAEAGVSVPVPSAYQSLVGLPINRALTPYFNFNASLANFDGITYTRASNATYIESYANARGIKSKRMKTDFNGSVTNSLARSEQFDDSTWVKSTNVTATKTGQKFNGSDVYLLKNDVAGTFRRINQVVSNTGVHTFSIIVKANTQSICFISLDGTDLGQSTGLTMTYRIDLKNERISYETSVNSFDNANVTLEYLSDGFYRVSLTPDRAATITNCFLYTSWSTSTAGSIFIAQAQLSNKNVPAPYVKTLSTSASQTFTAQPRIEDDGLLVEGSRTNVFTYSEQLDFGSIYAKNEASFIGEDYGFGVKMFKIAPNTTNGAHTIIRSVGDIASQDFVTASAFFKKNSSHRYIRFEVVDDSFTNRVYSDIDLGSGVFLGDSVNVGSALTVGRGIIDYGDYIRVAVSADFSAITTTLNRLTIRFLDNNDPLITSFAGNNFNSIITGGWQLEAGEVPTSYIKTLGATVSRASEIIQADMSLNHEFSVVVEGSYPFNNGTTQRRLLTMYNDSAITELIFFNTSGSNYDNAVIMQINSAFTTTLNSAIVNNDETSTAVLTRDNGTYNYYYQGELAEQLEAGLPFEISRIALGQSGAGSFNLNGYIKRIEVYNHAVTASEVKSK